MFVFRAVLTLAIAFLVTTNVEAQLFRFRRQARPQQSPSTYNAQDYQYTQSQRPMTRIPSQRYGQPNQQSAESQSQVVETRTFRDQRTGRLFQRQVIVNRPARNSAPSANDQPQNEIANKNQQATKSDKESVAKASSAELNSSILEGAQKIATTSFETPATDSEVLYSIFEPNVAGSATSVIEKKAEDALPLLDLPTPAKPSQVVPKKIDGPELEIDLAPLNGNSK